MRVLLGLDGVIVSVCMSVFAVRARVWKSCRMTITFDVDAIPNDGIAILNDSNYYTHSFIRSFMILFWFNK